MAHRPGVIAGLFAPFALLALSGCLSDQTRNQMAQSNSVLAPLFNQPTEVDAVVWANDEYDADKRARGTALLAFSPNGGDPKYVNYIYRRYLSDKDANVRTVATVAMGLHGTPEDVPQIVPLLQDPDRQVRRSAAHALQRLHNPAAIDPLLDKIDLTAKSVIVDKSDPSVKAVETEWEVRAEAADALGQYPEFRVLQRLIAALDDDQLVVNQSTIRSLKTLTGQELGVDRRIWARWLADNKDPFAGRTAYVYPVYSRSKTFLEYFPFVSGPPNEIASSPAGMPPVR